MPTAGLHRVVVELARSDRALAPSELAVRLDWPPDRAHAALRELVAMRPMPIGAGHSPC